MADENSTILNDVKNFIGIETDDHSYDLKIMITINHALFKINELGYGPSEGFKLSSGNEIWSDLNISGPELNCIISYVCVKSGLDFDPPQSSFLLTAMQEELKEDEWRLLNREMIAYNTKGGDNSE